NEDDEIGFKVAQDNGVLIVRVAQNSPAEQAGLQSGDIIQTVGGQSVKNAAEVQKLVEASQVGGNLEIKVIRNNKTETIQVKPGTFPTEESDN
ncbi:MAG TPA: PDZ domain-containing protein, partial [Coleofasciculaceae cyanobacterium]